jgi:hypothetical protein
MMQNLLQHIEDNENAGGEFTISAFTKPIDKKIGHLESGGGKIKFKIYPQSKDIKWAANADVFSGSVWDASTKVSKDKKSELLGVSYTKYPSLENINYVQPNLASIIDDLSHHHNELGISLTGNNFRLEYDEEIPYSTKKIINAVNSILDQKYGKLVTPKITAERKFISLQVSYKGDSSYKTVKTYESGIFRYYDISNGKETVKGLKANEFDFIDKPGIGIQPTQSKDNLKKTIADIKSNIDFKVPNVYKIEDVPNKFTAENIKGNPITIVKTNDGVWKGYLEDGTFQELPEENVLRGYNKSQGNLLTKEYTSQALVNTKIAKLKEVAKKYPRSLIRSEVKPIFGTSVGGNSQPFDLDDLPFQKVPSSVLNMGAANAEEVSTVYTGNNLEGFDFEVTKCIVD